MAGFTCRARLAWKPRPGLEAPTRLVREGSELQLVRISSGIRRVRPGLRSAAQVQRSADERVVQCGARLVRAARFAQRSNELSVLREPGARVQLIICGLRPPDRTELVLAPIKIPALSARPHELNRIIDEYARDATVALRSSARFTATDRDWVRTHAATSLPEIEKGTWRTVALRKAGNIRGAAALLGMGHTSLGEWFDRRRTERSVRERDGPDPLAQTRPSVRERDGPDPLAQTRRILRSARALREGLRRQRKAI